MRRFFSRGFRLSRRHEQLFPYVFALQPAQAVILGILSSQAVILALLDKIAGYFVQYPSFRAPGAFARARRSRRPSNWSPPEYIAGVWHQPGWFSGAYFRAPEPVGEKEGQILERSTS